MSASNFSDALSFVLAREGGYVNHPKDPGGPTNMGITLRVLAAFRGKTVTADDVKALAKAEAAAIYRKQYWKPIRGDDLPGGLDLALFDYAVNSGSSRAVRDLQKCLGITPDGVLGVLTLEAVRSKNVASLVNALCDRRLAFMRSLRTWGAFGKGWERRVSAVRETALALADDTPAPILTLMDASPGKAEEVDVRAWKTPEGKAKAAKVVGAVGGAATTVGGLVQPYGDTWQWIGGLAVALLAVGALAGVIVANVRGPTAEEANA